MLRLPVLHINAEIKGVKEMPWLLQPAAHYGQTNYFTWEFGEKIKAKNG